jgi:hypothetical protein
LTPTTESDIVEYTQIGDDEMTDRTERAERIAEALNETGEVEARVWEGDDIARVYVSRHLARRKQDMGYVEIDENGRITHLPVRRTSWVERIAEGV